MHQVDQCLRGLPDGSAGGAALEDRWIYVIEATALHLKGGSYATSASPAKQLYNNFDNKNPYGSTAPQNPARHRIRAGRVYNPLGTNLDLGTSPDPGLQPLPLAVTATYGFFAFNGDLPHGTDLSHCIAVAICDFKHEDSRVLSFLKAMRPRTDMPYGCIAVSMTGPSRFRSEITGNCNRYCSAGNQAEKLACRSETRYVRVFNSRTAAR